jgi:hypothetical protein
MKAHKDVDIVGNDIPCKANAFCQVCGGLEAVKEGCLQNNRCVEAAAVRVVVVVGGGQLPANG